MPKKEHVHIVTDKHHKELLTSLGKKYGSMTKAFESAIENLQKVETFSSCESCQIKFESEQTEKVQNLMNTISFTADNLQELMRYLRGDCSVSELILTARQKAHQFVKQYQGLLYVTEDNTYENLLTTVEEYKKRTRLFKAIEVDRFSKKIVARINVFEDLPVFIMSGLMGFLEGLGFTFKIEIYNSDIILTWLTPEVYHQEKSENEVRLHEYILDSERIMQPHLVKKGLICVTPDLVDWLAENTFTYHMLPVHIAYKFANMMISNPESLTRAQNACKATVQIIARINFAEEITSRIDEEKNSFRVRFLLRKPNLANLALQGLILILGKFGWKLVKHRIDSTQLDIKFKFVGEDDPSILEPLYLTNFSGFLNQRYQKLLLIPLDEYFDLMNNLFELNPQSFDEVFRTQGRKLAEAIKILAKNDLKRMREIAIEILPTALKQAYRDPKSLDVMPEYGKFTIIFKETNHVEMEQLRSIISGVSEGFGYKDIKSKIYENMVILEFIRPDEKPSKKEMEAAKAEPVNPEQGAVPTPSD
jgi:hypothetical protein